MSNTLQFYSIGAQQCYALLKIMEEGGAKVTPVTDSPALLVSGNTPLGEIDGEYTFNSQIGTLTVVVTKKPWAVPMGTIESHLRTALAKAATVEPPAPQVMKPTVEPAEPLTPPAVPAEPLSTPAQTEPTQTEVSAPHDSSH
jgi:hypothetical protein